MRPVRLIALPLVLILAACSSDTTTGTLTGPDPTLVTDVLAGSVGPAANGVLQKDTKSFVVAQGGGSVTITLTSAIETLPGGTLLTTVNMGLAVGTMSGTTCTLLANSSAIGAGGTTQLSGNLAAGTYCIQVSDVTNQVGPVAYAVAVVHP